MAFDWGELNATKNSGISTEVSHLLFPLKGKYELPEFNPGVFILLRSILLFDKVQGRTRFEPLNLRLVIGVIGFNHILSTISMYQFNS